jgi:hypothetical protein
MGLIEDMFKRGVADPLVQFLWGLASMGVGREGLVRDWDGPCFLSHLCARNTSIAWSPRQCGVIL